MMGVKKVSREDIIYHLENKLKLGEESDDEYGFYLEYRKYGNRVFNDSKFRSIINRLKRELEELYDKG